jgi:hypothetical protein
VFADAAGLTRGVEYMRRFCRKPLHNHARQLVKLDQCKIAADFRVNEIGVGTLE